VKITKAIAINVIIPILVGGILMNFTNSGNCTIRNIPFELPCKVWSLIIWSLVIAIFLDFIFYFLIPKIKNKGNAKNKDLNGDHNITIEGNNSFNIFGNEPVVQNLFYKSTVQYINSQVKTEEDNSKKNEQRDFYRLQYRREWKIYKSPTINVANHLKQKFIEIVYISGLEYVTDEVEFYTPKDLETMYTMVVYGIKSKLIGKPFEVGGTIMQGASSEEKIEMFYITVSPVTENETLITFDTMSKEIFKRYSNLVYLLMKNNFHVKQIS
jgi:hypothetical protein